MSALFHHDIVVATLGSGSRGNCTYVGDGRHGVLVDCGISTRQIYKRLAASGLEGAPIDAVLITHEHSDHVGAARIFDKKTHKRTGRRLPFYMTRATHQGVKPQCMPQRVETIVAGRSFSVGPFAVEPYTVPHDTPDPVAYVVDLGPMRVGVLSDLGHVTRLVQRKLASVDLAVLEFNHDLEMLLEGAYPWHLKQRIRSRHGHLSNAQAEDLLADVARHGRLREVVLAHLSEENNSEERAFAAASRALHRAGRSDVQVQVARQDEPIDPLRHEAPMSAPPGAANRLADPRVPRRARAGVAPGQTSLLDMLQLEG